MRRGRAAGALLLAIAAACSDGGGTDEPGIPAAQFAASTCDSLAPWGTAMDQAFATMKEPELTAARDANRRLRSDIDQQGAPAVEGGVDVKQSMLEAIDALDRALEKATDAGKIVEAEDDILAAFAMFDPTGSNAELRAAFSAAAACDDAFASLPP